LIEIDEIACGDGLTGLSLIILKDVNPEQAVTAELMESESDFLEFYGFSQDNDLGVLGKIGGYIFCRLHEKVPGHLKLIYPRGLRHPRECKIHIFREL